MDFYNTTTGKMVELGITDRKSGLDWTVDLLGNQQALIYNGDLDRYEISQEDYEWWADIIEKLEAIDDRIENLKNEVDYEDHENINQIIGDAGNGNDLESHVNQVNYALDQLFTQYEIE